MSSASIALPVPPAEPAAEAVPPVAQTVHSSRHFLAGAVGGIVAATILSPLDIVRTRLQSARGASLHLPAREMLLRVVRTEGPLALWRGLVPTIFGVGPARALYFGFYALAKERLAGGEVASSSSGSGRSGNFGLSGLPLHLAGSLMAGIFSNTIMSPWWVIRLRLQLQQTPVVAPWRRSGAVAQGITTASTDAARGAYRGVIDAGVRIYREEGWRAFYRGLSASYLGVAETVLQFTIYGELKRAMQAREKSARAVAGAAAVAADPAPLNGTGVFASSFTTHSWAFVLSACSKVLASALTYPHEVLRTRMREEVATDRSKLKYRTLLQSTRLILREEGVAGLYGGMGVHMLRTVPNAAILVYVVETMTSGTL